MNEIQEHWPSSSDAAQPLSVEYSHPCPLWLAVFVYAQLLDPSPRSVQMFLCAFVSFADFDLCLRYRRSHYYFRELSEDAYLILQLWSHLEGIDGPLTLFVLELALPRLRIKGTSPNDLAKQIIAEVSISPLRYMRAIRASH